MQGSFCSDDDIERSLSTEDESPSAKELGNEERRGRGKENSENLNKSSGSDRAIDGKVLSQTSSPPLQIGIICQHQRKNVLFLANIAVLMPFLAGFHRSNNQEKLRRICLRCATREAS